MAKKTGKRQGSTKTRTTGPGNNDHYPVRAHLLSTSTEATLMVIKGCDDAVVESRLRHDYCSMCDAATVYSIKRAYTLVSLESRKTSTTQRYMQPNEYAWHGWVAFSFSLYWEVLLCTLSPFILQTDRQQHHTFEFVNDHWTKSSRYCISRGTSTWVLLSQWKEKKRYQRPGEKTIVTIETLWYSLLLYKNGKGGWFFGNIFYKVKERSLVTLDETGSALRGFGLVW